MTDDNEPGRQANIAAACQITAALNAGPVQAVNAYAGGVGIVFADDQALEIAGHYTLRGRAAATPTQTYTPERPAFISHGEASELAANIAAVIEQIADGIAPQVELLHRALELANLVSSDTDPDRAAYSEA